MKLSELKIGDKIQCYCFSELVEATVAKREGNSVLVKHKTMRWGNDYFGETYIMPSTRLQMPYSQTTPGAFYNGEKITL
jgi:hypothetical protein